MERLETQKICRQMQNTEKLISKIAERRKGNTTENSTARKLAKSTEDHKDRHIGNSKH